ncbi:amino acid ABC transporter permease [Saccharopolyspora oryzae]|uniref:Amino acid ABC transporter permease n=1 Tax=Saccharopolyspora oryzae TaxID=2997343 RepID=A0ABT4UU41_9PSEU|nr:amino acid ABC transporter permease [Saccharopolyspora oryzae]MDA3625244.1 amino acid ABC transporter permease [Saccharopolyspora oryzae]
MSGGTATLTAKHRGDRAIADPVARKRHPGRWLSGIAVAVAVGFVLVSLYQNPALDHATIARFLTADTILAGLRSTVLLAIVSMAIGVVLGTALALMRLSRNPVLRAISVGYVTVVRGVPLLVQILFWGNIALFYDRVDLVWPFTGEVLTSWETNALITPFVASVLALSLNEAAYMAEIVRAGVGSIDRGQTEASTALGLNGFQTFRKVIAPQALKVVVPPTGSQFVTMLKMTSLVSVIAGGDLLTEAQNIAASNLRILELLVIASLWYLLITGLATIAQTVLERRLARSARKVHS